MKKAILLVFVLIVLVACAQQNEDGIIEQVDIKPEITVGWVGALSGKLAREGTAAKNAIEIAASEINNLEGGINGRELEVVFDDSATNPRQGADAVKKLINIDQVQYVIGAISSSVTLAMTPITEKNQIIHISPNSTSKNIDKAGDYIFKLRENIDTQAPLAVEFLIKRNLSKAAILYDASNDALITLKERFETEFKNSGGRVVLVEAYTNRQQTDFRSQLTRIKAREPQVIYLPIIGPPIEYILKQIKELNIQPVIFGNAIFEDQQLINNAGDAIEGVMFTALPFDCEFGGQITRDFCKQYQDKYGEIPIYHAGYAYDGLKVLAYVLRQVNDPLNTEKVKQALYNLKDYQGVTGEISLDEQGNVTDKEFVIKQIKNGKFVLYEE